VWRALIQDYFSRWIGVDDTVLDLGCGYGEFVTQVTCKRRLGMDLNPDAALFAGPSVDVLSQDCAAPWPLQSGSLDVVFTSNFLEHMSDKSAVGRVLDEVHRCLRSGGRFIALGPNIRHVPGAYWDFWDHHVPLTDLSLAEALETRGFRIDARIGRFLPYTMVDRREYPVALVRLYLRLPMLWRFVGRQFLVVASKPADGR
jgi:SAM-dependent methyltransferase